MQLFDTETFHAPAMPDADVRYYPRLFAREEADALFARLHRETEWRQDNITVYGREFAVPRLSAWHGAPDTVYIYSGIKFEAAAWTPTLRAIKNRVEELSDARFNSVLLNLYRDGGDSVSWHADDEPELGRAPVIGSVSLGAERVFQMKHKRKALRQKLLLEHGSYLLMQGGTQRNWLHQVPKCKGATGTRINLTFRRVVREYG